MSLANLIKSEILNIWNDFSLSIVHHVIQNKLKSKRDIQQGSI